MMIVLIKRSAHLLAIFFDITVNIYSRRVYGGALQEQRPVSHVAVVSCLQNVSTQSDTFWHVSALE